MRWNPKVVYPIVVIAIGILGATTLISSRTVVQTQAPEIPPPLVRALRVHTESLQLKVKAQGTVAPRTESVLVSQVAGQIVWVSPAFASGGFFEAGDLLVRLDRRDYELGLARARVQVAQAKVRLAREEEEAGVARQEWSRVGKGEATPLVLREPQLAEARASLEAARAVWGQAQLSLERTEVRAPYAGRVRMKLADVGQFVNPGVGLARLYAVDYAEVRLPIPDAQLAFLDLSLDFRGSSGGVEGPEVTWSADFAGGRHTWVGRIVRVEGEIDSRTRMVHLVGRVEDPYGRVGDVRRPPLAVGLFVEAEIFGRRVEDVVVLPRSVLRGGDEVLVVDVEDRLRFRRVGVVRADAEGVVIGSGLLEGERVCVSPLDAVVDGMRVRVVSEEGSEVAFRGEGGGG